MHFLFTQNRNSRKTKIQKKIIYTEARFGARMGNKSMIDGMIKDGLWDVFTDQHMGSCADIVANKHNITREKQDEYAIQSFKRAIYANDNKIFENEILPIQVTDKKNQKTITNDECCAKFNENKLKQLKPVFGNTGCFILFVCLFVYIQTK